MLPDFIVVTPPVLDQQLVFQPVAEPLDGQAHLPKFSFEALVGPVLPRLTGLINTDSSPSSTAQRNCAMLTNSSPLSLQNNAMHHASFQPAKQIDDPPGPERTGKNNSQTFPGVLIDLR